MGVWHDMLLKCQSMGVRLGVPFFGNLFYGHVMLCALKIFHTSKDTCIYAHYTYIYVWLSINGWDKEALRLNDDGGEGFFFWW
jgi:hypothetical protein